MSSLSKNYTLDTKKFTYLWLDQGGMASKVNSWQSFRGQMLDTSKRSTQKTNNNKQTHK